jgi:hypothetical protein
MKRDHPLLAMEFNPRLEQRLFTEVFNLVGYFLQMFLHLQYLGFHVFFVFPQQFAALLQSRIPFKTQFYEVLDLLDGHTRILETADQTEPFKVILRVTTYTAPAPCHTWQEAFILIVTQDMRGQTSFFRNLFD